MDFVELKKHLKSGKPYAGYACYGDDEYVLGRALALIKALASEPTAFNSADREFASARELIDELMQLPVTGDYRVVVARGKFDAEQIEKYLKAPNPSAVLVLSCYTPHDSWNKASAPVFPSGIEPVNCNRLAIKYVGAFVGAEMTKTGASIDDAAINALYTRCAGYMTRISSEAQKLALMRSGGSVTAEDVVSNVRGETEFVVFELTDSILNRDAARALAIVDGMAKNNDLAAAFTLLYNRFKRMFVAAVDPDGLAALGVKPYMAAKLKTESAKFSKPRLKDLLDKLADADYGYKTGATSQYDALCSFVAQAASGG